MATLCTQDNPQSRLCELFCSLIRMEISEDLRTNPEYFGKKMKVFIEASTYFGFIPIGLKMNTPQGLMIRKMYRRAVDIVMNENSEGRSSAIMVPSVSYSRLYSFSTPYIQYSLAKALSATGEIVNDYVDIDNSNVIILFIHKERTYGIFYDFKTRKMDILFSLSMNRQNPIDKTEIFHMLKWYYTNEGGKTVENKKFIGTPYLIHGLDIKGEDRRRINIKTTELTADDFETESGYNVYQSFAPFIKRCKIDRDFYLINDKGTHFNWFNPAAGYMMSNPDTDMVVLMEFDKTSVYIQGIINDEGEQLSLLKEKREMAKAIPEDLDKCEYMRVYHEIKEILYVELFKSNFQESPVFAWARDSPVVTQFENDDNLVDIEGRNGKEVVDEIMGDNIVLKVDGF